MRKCSNATGLYSLIIRRFDSSCPEFSKVLIKSLVPKQIYDSNAIVWAARVNRIVIPEYAIAPHSALASWNHSLCWCTSLKRLAFLAFKISFINVLFVILIILL